MVAHWCGDGARSEDTAAGRTVWGWENEGAQTTWPPAVGVLSHSRVVPTHLGD